MDVQASVIEELRIMFKEGATPSRLIQHIVARHPDEGNWHGLIQTYFREGFGVPIVRGLNPAETYDDIGLRYTYLNENVLHEMVQWRPVWDQEANRSEDVSSSWLGSLMATSALDRLHNAKQAGAPSAFSESWGKLSEHERNAIILTNSGSQGCSEMVHILARLVERLQQRIVELEQNRSEPTIAEVSSG